MSPTLKTTVSYGSCTLYFSDRAVVCPLCGVHVPKATSHTCEKKASKARAKS
jgi:hypothetical protein